MTFAEANKLVTDIHKLYPLLPVSIVTLGLGQYAVKLYGRKCWFLWNRNDWLAYANSHKEQLKAYLVVNEDKAG